MPTKKVSEKTVELHLNDNLPTLIVDNLNVSTRMDNHYFLRFLTHLPEGMKEQARIIVPTGSLHRMLEVLCAHVDYYPKKKIAKKKVAKKKA